MGIFNLISKMSFPVRDIWAVYIIASNAHLGLLLFFLYFFSVFLLFEILPCIACMVFCFFPSVSAAPNESAKVLYVNIVIDHVS